MFGWYHRLVGNTTFKNAVVTFDDQGVRCQRENGLAEEVTWEELEAVDIITTDSGPIVEDVFWVLLGAKRGCVVPQEAEGCRQLLEQLQKLPGFNNEEVIKAMTCTANARFAIWQKERTSSSLDVGQQA